MNFKALFTLLFTITCTTLGIAQFEMDLTTGVHLSNIKFHHSSPVDTDDDAGFQSWSSSNYTLGLTSPIGKSWHLRTELGLLKTNTFFAIIYDYDEGLGQQSSAFVTYLSNQKMFLSILPEYRIQRKNLSINFYGGPMLTADISNSFTTSNTNLLPKSKPLGLKVGAGINYRIKDIGFTMNTSLAFVSKSQLINRYHPAVSYTHIIMNFGVVYYLS